MPDIDWTGILSDIAPQAIRIVVVLVLGYIMWRLVEHMAPRFIRLILRRDFQTRDAEEVGQRLDTLVSASRRISGLLILIAVTLIVLAEVGVSIAPMLAGIGIAGIAIGFASQNLVRDVLNGMIILVEDWYSKGDVVRIAGIAGLVEDITLRRTILRDLDGIVHSIPNGEVTVASNFTKDWSRVNLNVSVAYGEDLDRVMSIINQVGRQLADDPHFGTLVLEAPYALRVDSFGDSGIEIKILGNTRPLKQWEVTGELRRRIKRRFDEEQIEIPWPHTKLYFGNELEQREADKEIRSGQKHLESPTLKEAPHAMMHKERVAAIIAKPRWALITDVDGTLSPIAPTPEEAIVPGNIRALLAELSEHVPLMAVVSGRPAAQTRELVGIDGVTYIGQHGLEYWKDGEGHLTEGAELYLDTIARALDEIERVTELPGVRIERKGITATVHYRQAPDANSARSAILAAIAHSPSATGLKVTEGRRVVELRPPLTVNKGSAVRTLVTSNNIEGAMYIGDDITDLDAFYALRTLREEGLPTLSIGVVSNESRTEFLAAIDLRLASVEEVGQLLTWIRDEVAGNQKA